MAAFTFSYICFDAVDFFIPKMSIISIEHVTSDECDQISANFMICNLYLRLLMVISKPSINREMSNIFQVNTINMDIAKKLAETPRNDSE